MTTRHSGVLSCLVRRFMHDDQVQDTERFENGYDRINHGAILPIEKVREFGGSVDIKGSVIQELLDIEVL